MEYQSFGFLLFSGTLDSKNKEKSDLKSVRTKLAKWEGTLRGGDKRRRVIKRNQHGGGTDCCLGKRQRMFCYYQKGATGGGKKRTREVNGL